MQKVAMAITQRVTRRALNFIWTKVSANAPIGPWWNRMSTLPHSRGCAEALLSPGSTFFFPEGKSFSILGT